jgi:cell wall-associated NlpC family hydrolase
VAAAVAAAILLAVVLVKGATASAAAAANSTAQAANYGDGNWGDDCDPEYEVCGDDDGYGNQPDDNDGGYYQPTAPTAPTGPTGPIAPPVTYWPAPPKGAVAKLRANNRTAVAPKSAPPPVKAMIKAANSLTRKPYVWGGGHGKWYDRGYDCSGSTSFVLRAGGQLSWPMVSGDLAKWGKTGRGRWVQIYANNGHVFMVIAGLRFDTSGAGESGPRWRAEGRMVKGFRLRHPAGL